MKLLGVSVMHHEWERKDRWGALDPENPPSSSGFASCPRMTLLGLSEKSHAERDLISSSPLFF